MKDVVESAKDSLQRPSDFGWWGRDDMFITWGFSGVGKHRDSDLLQLSNFSVVTEDLMERFPDDFQIVGMGHWAVGHTDSLIVRVLENESDGFVEDNITDAFKAAWDWLDTLSDYCIADESHYSELVSDSVFEYTVQAFPEEIYSADLDDSVGSVLYYLQEDNYYDYDSSVPSTEEMLLAAYHLRLCDYEHKDFWDDFAMVNSLPVIVWNEYTFGPSGVPKQIDGQLSLDVS
jgi:hypothetical protein